MPALLKIEAITDDGLIEVTQLRPGSAVVGREPENDIVVDSKAVSRQHAQIISFGDHWVLRDLGSTNGTFLNGVKLEAHQMRLLCDGDTVVFADVGLRLSEIGTGNLPKGSQTRLILVNGERYLSDVVFDQGRSRFVLGGPEADYALEGDSREAPQLVIAEHEGRVELTVGRPSVPVTLNRMVVNGVSDIVDRDEVCLGDFRVLIYDPRSRNRAAGPAAEQETRQAQEGREPSGVYERPSVPEHLRAAEEGWEPVGERQKHAGKKYVFGTPPEGEGVSGTIAMDRGAFGPAGRGVELSPSQRFSAAVQTIPEDPKTTFGERLLIVFGFLLFAALIAIGVYFLLVHGMSPATM